MGSTNTGRTFVATSASDLSTYKYRLVKDSTGSTDTNRIVELCGNGDVPCGILEYGDVAGRKMEVVRLNGQSTKLTVGGVVALGSLIKCDTAATLGKGIATTTDGNRFFAVAEEISTADGDVVAVYTCNAFRGA